jgi:putative PIN family toxin of toxin-antitoxin system
MLRVVLDSSVLVSGFLTEGGTTAALLSRFRQGDFALCTSRWIVEETERALLRPRNTRRYRYQSEDVRQFLDGLAKSAQMFRDAPRVPAVTRDPSDDQVIACALAAKADYLVTGDQDMLVLAEHEGIRIVTPRQFLDLLGGPGADRRTS